MPATFGALYMWLKLYKASLQVSVTAHPIYSMLVLLPASTSISYIQSTYIFNEFFRHVAKSLFFCPLYKISCISLCYLSLFIKYSHFTCTKIYIYSSSAKALKLVFCSKQSTYNSQNSPLSASTHFMCSST